MSVKRSWDCVKCVEKGRRQLSRLIPPVMKHQRHTWLAVWLSGNTLIGFDQRSCATSDPVSTRMGDRLWTGKPFRYVTSQLG